MHAVGHGAGAENNLLHAAFFIIAGIQHMGAQQVSHIAGARCIELALPGNAAEQAHVVIALHMAELFQALTEIDHGVGIAHLVEDHSKHLRRFRPAKHLHLDFDQVRQFAEAFALRGRDQNHLGIQALGQVQVDLAGIAGVAVLHHAFDDHHIVAFGGLLVEADDVFQQLVQLAITEAPFDIGLVQRCR